MDLTNFLGYKILDNYLNYDLQPVSLSYYLSTSVIWLLSQSATEIPFAKAPEDLGGRKLRIGENLKNPLVQHMSSVWQPHKGGAQSPRALRWKTVTPRAAHAMLRISLTITKTFFLY